MLVSVWSCHPLVAAVGDYKAELYYSEVSGQVPSGHLVEAYVFGAEGPKFSL